VIKKYIFYIRWLINNFLFKAIYRDVPTPEELKLHFGSNPPRIPENAEALIDLGLSMIPKRKFICLEKVYYNTFFP